MSRFAVRACAITVGLAAVVGLGTAASAHVTPLPWRTCVAQQTLRDGIYRVDNDLFDGASGRSCIESTSGHNLTIQTSYKPRGASVVGYPDIRVGSFYGSRDTAATFLPEQVAKPHPIILHLASTGNAGGLWLADADLWFYNTDVIREHGTRELVIANRYTFDTVCPKVLKIGGLRYCANRHLTGRAGHRWPLIVLRLIRPRHYARVDISKVFAVRQIRRWIGGGKWLGSIAYGVECWSGCNGLTASLTVNP
jgi:hypothetical protein